MLRFTGANGTGVAFFDSGGVRLNVSSEGGTHRDGEGARRRRFCMDDLACEVLEESDRG